MARPPVVWTLPAREDFLQARRYLVEEAKVPQAATKLFEDIDTAAASLEGGSEKGRIVPELGPPYRELIVRNYRLVYRIRSSVEILRLIHSRRDFLASWRDTQR